MDNHPVTARARRLRATIWLCAVVLGAVALSACGKTSSTGSVSATASAAAPRERFLQRRPPRRPRARLRHRPDGALPRRERRDRDASAQSYTSQFNGYATPIFKSAYADFKPKHPRLHVGISVTAADQPLPGRSHRQLQKDLQRSRVSARSRC